MKVAAILLVDLLLTADAEVIQILARMPYIQEQCLMAATDIGNRELVDYFLRKGSRMYTGGWP